MQTVLLSAIFAALLQVTPAVAQQQQGPRPGTTLAEACRQLPVIDSCNLIAEAAAMLRPSYEEDKAGAGEASFRALGYDATYVRARSSLLRPPTDVFLVSRRRSNRLFIVITGTEEMRDWISNAQFGSYSAAYNDGQFYIPPGHAGFRGGMLNINQQQCAENQ